MFTADADAASDGESVYAAWVSHKKADEKEEETVGNAERRSIITLKMRAGPWMASIVKRGSVTAAMLVIVNVTMTPNVQKMRTMRRGPSHTVRCRSSLPRNRIL